MRNFNATAILWTKKDFNLMMAEIEDAINDSLENRWDEKIVADSCVKMRYLANLLTFIQLKMPAVLLRETAKAYEGLISLHGDSSKKDQFEELRECSIEAFLMIPNLLEYLSEGNKDIPEVVAPAINKMRDVLGVKRIQGSEMFWPDTFVDTSFLASDSNYIEINSRRERLEYLNVLFDGFLINWIKNENPSEALLGLSSISRQIYEIVPYEYDKKLFWVSECIFLSLSKKEFVQSLHTRHVLAKLNKRIKLLSELSVSETANTTDPEDQENLLDQLLFSVAFEGSSAANLEDVLLMFRLDEVVYTSEDVEKAKAILGGRNQNVMELVARGIREDLYYVKDSVDLYMRSGTPIENIENKKDKLIRSASALTMIQFNSEAEFVTQLQEKFQKILDSIDVKAPFSATTSLCSDFMAGILKIDNIISNKIAPESFENVTEKGLQLKILGEAFLAIAKTKQSIIYFSENKDYSKIADVTKWTRETVDALAVLGDKTALTYFKKLNDLLEYLQKETPSLSDDEVFSLASAVSCLEYYLEAKRDRQPDPYRILDESRQFFLALGDWDPVRSVTEEDFISSLENPSENIGELPVTEVLSPQTIFTQSPTQSTPQADDKKISENISEIIAVQPGQKIIPFDGLTEGVVDEELQLIFTEEMQEEIDSIKLHLALFEKDKNIENLSQIRKSFHTIKGSGRMTGALALGDIASGVEQVLNKITEGHQEFRPIITSFIDIAVQMFEKFILSIHGQEQYWEAEEFNAWCKLISSKEDMPFKIFKKIQTSFTDAPQEEVNQSPPEAQRSSSAPSPVVEISSVSPSEDVEAVQYAANDLEIDPSLLLSEEEEALMAQEMGLIEFSSDHQDNKTDDSHSLDFELSDMFGNDKAHDFLDNNSPAAPTFSLDFVDETLSPRQPENSLDFASQDHGYPNPMLDQSFETPLQSSEPTVIPADIEDPEKLTPPQLTKNDEHDFSFSLDSELFRTTPAPSEDNQKLTDDHDVSLDLHVSSAESSEQTLEKVQFSDFSDFEFVFKDDLELIPSQKAEHVSVLDPEVLKIAPEENLITSFPQEEPSPFAIISEEPPPSPAFVAKQEFVAEQEKKFATREDGKEDNEDKDVIEPLSVFTGYSALPNLKNIQQNGWRENLSLLLETINTLEKWSEETEAAERNGSGKIAFEELKNQLIGFQKRATVLVEVASRDMTSRENKINKEDIRHLIEERSAPKVAALPQAQAPAQRVQPEEKLSEISAKDPKETPVIVSTPEQSGSLTKELEIVTPNNPAAPSPQQSPPPKVSKAPIRPNPLRPRAEDPQAKPPKVQEFNVLKEEKKSFIAKVFGVFSRKK